MFASTGRRVVGVLCACVALGAMAIGAPAASANDDALASWVAGKLVSGAGGAAASYAIGNVMARAGLDPTANELHEISAQLNRLSEQMSALKKTSDATFQEVLNGFFDTRLDQLDISTITKFEGDIACYVDRDKTESARDACHARFRLHARGAQLWRVADKFNDLLTHSRSTIVQAYAKVVVGARRFFTVEDQRKVYDLFVYLDDLQVAATLSSIEAENLAAVGKNAEAVQRAHAAGRAEATTLEERRHKQLQLNPTYPNDGVLDRGLRLWLSTSWRGQTTYWNAKGSGRWSLPSANDVLNLVKDRGNKTVKQYLIQDAGMGAALEKVDEFGPNGELWTSTKSYKCGFDYLYNCYETISTNNAYVRAYGASPGASTPKFFSFLLSRLNDKELARYSFLWN